MLCETVTRFAWELGPTVEVPCGPLLTGLHDYLRTQRDTLHAGLPSPKKLYRFLNAHVPGGVAHAIPTSTGRPCGDSRRSTYTGGRSQRSFWTDAS